MPSATSARTRKGYFTIRLDNDVREVLERIAVENDRSMSAEIRRSLREYVQAYAREAKGTR